MITAKQYDILMTKLIVIENKQEVIMNTQSEILSTLKSLTNKTVGMSMKEWINSKKTSSPCRTKEKCKWTDGKKY